MPFWEIWLTRRKTEDAPIRSKIGLATKKPPTSTTVEIFIALPGTYSP